MFVQWLFHFPKKKKKSSWSAIKTVYIQGEMEKSQATMLTIQVVFLYFE